MSLEEVKGPETGVELGDLVGSYRIEAEIGAGGMGRVYRARHVLIGKVAALKLLDQRFAAENEYVSRFFQEARIVNEIGHPNIIDIIDFIHEGTPRRVAYVMEFLKGRPLAELIGRVSFTQALNATV